MMGSWTNIRSISIRVVDSAFRLPRDARRAALPFHGVGGAGPVGLVREQRWWHLREARRYLRAGRAGQGRRLAGRQGRDPDRATCAASGPPRGTCAKQPKLAKAAAKGKLSEEQLDHASDLAGEDPDEDERWASDAPDWSPEDLAEEGARAAHADRRGWGGTAAARELRFWWRHDHGMLDGRFSLPDIDGAIFESVMNEMIERMRPAKGQPWDTREHRGADALVELCRCLRGAAR